MEENKEINEKVEPESFDAPAFSEEEKAALPIEPPVKQKQNFPTSKKKKKIKIKKTKIDIFASLFFTLGLIAFFVAILPLVSVIGMALYYVLLIGFAAMTIFLIFLNEDFQKLLTNSGNVFNQIVNLIQYSPYILYGSTGLLILSAILSGVSKTKRGKGSKIAVSIIFAVLGLTLGILISTGVLGKLES